MSAMLRTSMRSISCSSGNGQDKMAHADGGPIGTPSLAIWHVARFTAAQSHPNPISKLDSSCRRVTEDGVSFPWSQLPKIAPADGNRSKPVAHYANVCYDA